MKLKYVGYGLLSANLLIGFFFGIIAMDALGKSWKDPIPVYGDWKEIVGRQFWFNASGDVSEGLEIHGSAEVFIYPSSITTNILHIYRYKGATLSDLPNSTFVRSTLLVKITSLNSIYVGIGTHEFLSDVSSDGQWKDYHVDLHKILSFRAEANKTVEMSLNLAERLFGSCRIEREGYNHDDLFRIWENAVWWNTSAATITIVFDYKEIWKYTPLEGYDFTEIYAAQNMLNLCGTVFLCLAICDVVACLMLLGLWLDTIRKENNG